MVPLYQLNPQQRAAVETIAGPVLVLSGAGTGKTRTVTYRIAHMLAKGIAPEHILAVTFTNKAAREMVDRVKQLVGKAVRRMHVSTFHSFGLRLVREHAAELGLRPQFSIYDAHDQLALVKKALRAVSVTWKNYRPEDILFRMNAARTIDGGIEPDGSDSVENAIISSVWQTYRQTLRTCNAVDFEDLLLMPVRLLKSHRAVLEKCRAQFTHILVDEYQDTNSLQFELIHLLGRKHKNVCVVGDDDQSIYGWRGAEVRNILDFERHFPGAKVIRLEENYRSTSVILDAANAVIHKNTERKEKKLWTKRKGGRPLRIMVAPDDATEAEMIVADIIAHCGEHHCPFGSYALLMRMNTQARPFEDALRRYKIPYTIVGGMQFYDRKEIRDFLAYLRVIANTQDEEALLRVINTPPRAVGEGTVQKLNEFAHGRGIGLYAALGAIRECPDLKKAALTGLEQFSSLVEEARSMVTTAQAAPSAVARGLWAKLGYERELETVLRTPEDVAERMANVESLIDGIVHFEQQTPGATIEEFLRQIALLNNDDDEELKDGRLAVMTIHASKGLEFPQVYLVGVEHGVMPHSRSIEEKDGEAEERRLFYVAITRARNELTISYPRARMKYGKLEPRKPSEFLDDLPPELVEWHRDAFTKEATSDQIAGFLDQFRKSG